MSYGYARSRSFPDDYFGWLFGAAVVIIVIIGLIFESVVHQVHGRTVTLCSKERVTKSGGGGEYRIYANGSTYVIADSHWFGTWRTNSADVYSTLSLPGTYDIKYIGYRNGLTSSFPNIMSFTRVADNKSAIAACPKS